MGCTVSSPREEPGGGADGPGSGSPMNAMSLGAAVRLPGEAGRGGGPSPAGSQRQRSNSVGVEPGARRTGDGGDGGVPPPRGQAQGAYGAPPGEYNAEGDRTLDWKPTPQSHYGPRSGDGGGGEQHSPRALSAEDGAQRAMAAAEANGGKIRWRRGEIIGAGANGKVYVVLLSVPLLPIGAKPPPSSPSVPARTGTWV